MAQRADRRFIWNGYLLKDFLTAPYKRFCLPLVHGCMYLFNDLDFLSQFNNLYSISVISINQVNVNNSTFTWALISRRSVFRAGTRFFRRGIDKNVSNYHKITHTKIMIALTNQQLRKFHAIFSKFT